MQVKNQIVVISGILALLATATIAAGIYITQPVQAQTCTNGGSSQAYGCTVIAPNGRSGTWGSQVSSAAQDDSSSSTHQGLGDWRANGCKTTQTRGTSNAGLC
jgi:hypothetical protein